MPDCYTTGMFSVPIRELQTPRLPVCVLRCHRSSPCVKGNRPPRLPSSEARRMRNLELLCCVAFAMSILAWTWEWTEVWMKPATRSRKFYQPPKPNTLPQSALKSHLLLAWGSRSPPSLRAQSCAPLLSPHWRSYSSCDP
eukprot:1181518-Prorocentrum_minimum.AAC.1